MLDHMTFRVTDIARTKAFYTAALAPLGYSLCFEGNYGSNMLGFAYPAPSEPDGKKADVWFIDGPRPTVGRPRPRAATWRGGPPRGPRSMPSTAPPWKPGAKTTEPRACGPITTPTTTARLSSTRKATTSKRCATCRSKKHRSPPHA